MKKTSSSSFAIVAMLLFVRLGFAAPMTRAAGAGLPGRSLSPDQLLHSGRFANSSNSIFAGAPRSIDPSLATPGDAGTAFTADLVLGWPNFDTPFTDPFLATVGIPNGAAIDRSVTPNRIYVSDRATSRISGWSDVNALTKGAPADLILGQPTFFSSGANNGTLPGDVNGLGPDSLNFPVGLTVDSAGNLYVADELNHRVLEYHQPYASCSSLPCVGPAASVVFGQGAGMGASGGSFTTAVAAAGQTGLNFPQGVGVDSNGNVFVGDTANHRVLEYDTPLANPSSPNVTANRVYGEGASGNDFNAVDGGTSQVLMFYPEGIALDSNNDLFVADSGNDRVAEFDNPVSGNNFLMTRVFGQQFANNFNSSDEGIVDQSHTTDPEVPPSTVTATCTSRIQPTTGSWNSFRRFPPTIPKCSMPAPFGERAPPEMILLPRFATTTLRDTPGQAPARCVSRWGSHSIRRTICIRSTTFSIGYWNSNLPRPECHPHHSWRVSYSDRETLRSSRMAPHSHSRFSLRT